MQDICRTWVSSIIGGISGAAIGGIRGGAQGALVGLATGMVFAPIATLGIMGTGFGIAAIAGCSTTMGLGVSFGIFTSIAASFNVYELAVAKNERERLAAGVSLVMTVGCGVYGGIKIYSMPNLPPNLKAPSWGLFPNNKSHLGTWFSEAAAILRGERVVAREVYIRTPNSPKEKIRIDLVVKTLSGELKYIESKNGPKAHFTRNQKLYLEDFKQNGGTIVGHAGESAGLNHGDRVTNVTFQLDTWNGANP